MGIRVLGATMFVAVVFFARPSKAEDLFEIQVFHARVAPEGHFAAELHSNWVPRGARVDTPGEANTQGVLFEMLEPSVGVAPGWEIGAHLQQSFRSDGTLDWGGLKARTMALLTRDPNAALQLAVNVEGGYMPARYDAARWGTEIRPVIEWVSGKIDLDLNPILAFPWAGDRAGVPHLQPAASMRVTIADVVAPGVEYYAQLGPITAIPAAAEQRHYVFGTLDVVRWPDWLLHAGLGLGLTSASSHWIVTTRVGHVF